jgi:hypothetical protein
MARHRSLSLLILSLVAIVCLIALLTSVVTPKIVIAQSSGPANPAAPSHVEPEWASSAEVQPGTPVELLSPPDALAPSGPEAAAPEASWVSWRVTGTALRPREHDVNYDTSITGACAYAASGDASTVWNTVVILPQGSTVGTLRMYYRDTSASNTTAWLTVYDLYGQIVHEWPVTSSGSTGNGYNDSPTINHTVDYNLYSYLINWRPVVAGTTMQVCGFRLFYEPPPFGINFLPLTRK